MVQPVAYLNQALDMAIQLIRPRRQQPAIERYLALFVKQGAHLVQRKAGRARQRDQPQLVKHAGGVLATQTVAARRRDQPFLLVMPQRGRRDPAQARHRADIQFFCH